MNPKDEVALSAAGCHPAGSGERTMLAPAALAGWRRSGCQRSLKRTVPGIAGLCSIPMLVADQTIATSSCAERRFVR